MACCKAGHKDLSDWCKDEPIVYTDDKGKEYCVYHAPVGRKDCTKEEFEQKLKMIIEQHLSENTPCSLSGTVFEWDINFPELLKSSELRNLSMRYAYFNGNARFSNMKFAGGKTNFDM